MTRPPRPRALRFPPQNPKQAPLPEEHQLHRRRWFSSRPAVTINAAAVVPRAFTRTGAGGGLACRTSSAGRNGAQPVLLRSFSSSAAARVSHLPARRALSSSFPLPDFGKLDPYEPPPNVDRAEFLKTIRKCAGLYDTMYSTIVEEFRVANAPLSPADTTATAASTLPLSPTERAAFLESLACNLAFPRNVHRHFDKASNGAALFPSAIYTHMSAGLGNYCLHQKGVAEIDEAFRFVTYYRSPVMLEEL